MAVLQTNIFTVIKRFPYRKDVIKRLYKEDNNFKTICEDYGKCLEAYRYWNESGSKEACARREEYAMLRGELETELIQSLAEPHNI
ncbi:hypothetical protein D1AOALGA4SA_12158 [Olavius algarvensis Delta 1 endosymbiont]|nr:hypothetical protein D1AOALGA4SA_12158 [Olavius algarvensis Delta 1 endosymbiont]